MSAYLIVDQLEITDRETMQQYVKGVGATIAKYDGTFLVRGGDFAVMEGSWRPKRVVVLEFPDMATLKEWYDSEDYAALKAMRLASSSSNIIAVEGA